MTNIFALLADSALTRATGDYVVLSATAVALAAQSLPLVLSCFSIAGSIHTNIHGVGVSGVLKELGRHLIAA